MADPAFGLTQWATLSGLVAGIMAVIKYFESKITSAANNRVHEDVKAIMQQVITLERGMQELHDLHTKTDETGAPLVYFPRGQMAQVVQKLDEQINLQRKTLSSLTRLVTLREGERSREG